VNRFERSFRTAALILKRYDFGEADRLLTVLTPGHGKIAVLARGARKLTSVKTGHVELFTRVDLLIQTGRDLGQVAQVEMTKAYLPLREDLTRGAYAAYAVELVDRFTTQDALLPDGATADAEDSAHIFSLLDDAFKRIADDADPRLAVRYFELRLLDAVGFRPELTQCVIEGESITAQDQFLSYLDGGAVCPEHAVRCQSVVPISMAGLKLLRHLQRSSYERVVGLQITSALHDEVERVMQGYITHVLERRPQTIEFIRRLRQ